MADFDAKSAHAELLRLAHTHGVMSWEYAAGCRELSPEQMKTVIAYDETIPDRPRTGR